MNEEKRMRVWWIPQVPSSRRFFVEVFTVGEALLIYKTLAEYDIFQFEQNIKPDFCNAGGLEILEEDEWTDYYDDDGRDLEEIMGGRGAPEQGAA